MTRRIPLQNKFFEFYLRKNLGNIKQWEIAEIIGCSVRALSFWWNRSDPEENSLRKSVKGINRHLVSLREAGDLDEDELVEAFFFIREIERREASLQDNFPRSTIDFLTAQRLVDADGKPTEKLVLWLTSKPAPLEAPKYVSREQAFTADKFSSAVWLNPHNHYSLPLCGRENELVLLDKFIKSKEPFKIAALVAPSGAGKTRLISEWAKPYIVGDMSDEWDAGFVESPNADLWSEENWQPSKNTLIIIDYTYNYADVIGAIWKRFEQGAPFDVRLLVIDHVLPEKLHQDTAFRKGVPSLGFLEAKRELFFETWPIALHPISNRHGFLREIIAAAADPFTEDERAKRYKPESPEITSAADALMEIGAVEEASATPDQIKRRDTVRHPLFAALFGQMIHQNPKSDFSGMTRRDLVGHYFENERRLPWSDASQNPTVGFWVGFYVSAATLLRGVANNDILDFHDDPPKTTEPVLEGKDFKRLRDICGRFVSSEDQLAIKPFEPDILGETFVLKFLSEKQTGTDYRALASFLSLCCQSGRFEDPVGSFLETMKRLVRNLVNDDQELDEVREAWSVLERFLDPKWFPVATEIREAVSIALGNLVKQRREVRSSKLLLSYAVNIDTTDLAQAACGMRWRTSSVSAVHAVECLLYGDGLDKTKSEELLRVLAIFRSRSSENQTALLLAVSEGCLNASKFFYEALNESFDSADDFGRSAITEAARIGNVKIIEWLCAEGATIDFTRTSRASTAFLIACSENNLGAAQTLKKNGSNFHVRNVQGENAAICASAGGALEVLQWLHAENADLEATDRFGANSAMHASKGGYLELLQWLHAKEIDIHATALNGDNAAIYACKNGHIHVLDWLSKMEVDIHVTASDGMNAALWATVWGRLDALKWLHARGVNIHALSRYRKSGAMYAALLGHLEVMRWLYKKEVDIHQLDALGRNAAMWAASAGQLSVLQWLHRREADLSLLDSRGMSITDLAKKEKQKEVIRWLAEIGIVS